LVCRRVLTILLFYNHVATVVYLVAAAWLVKLVITGEYSKF
jgi:hypothetical protein